MKRLILAALAACLLNTPLALADNISPSSIETSGSFSPAITFGGNATGVTYGAANLGTWRRIGDIVFLKMNLVLTSKGSDTGAAKLITPFTTVNDSVYCPAAVTFQSGFSGVTGVVAAMWPTNSTGLLPYQINAGAAAGLTATQFGNTTNLYLTAVCPVQ